MIHIFRSIHEHCRQQQFDVNILLHNLGSTYSQIRDVTYKHFGLSPAKVIEGSRLDIALKRLEHGEHFGIVADKCGFGCEKTFHRAFKKRIGITAQQARKLLAESSDKQALYHQWRLNIWSTGGGLPPDFDS
ncbi:MAG: helix-turn-helix domain-containing protein [Candidatus Kapaibacterium sp.]